MTTQELKCADRIEGQLADREAQIQALINNPDADEYHDDPALSVDTVKVTTICLSWGGPADYLEVTHRDGEVERVIYRFSDWFDTATRELESDSPLYSYAVGIIETLG